MEQKKIIKSAIYTRKSSEEGLELGRVHRTSCATRHVRRPVSNFNSLDAQREACESYIKSQKHEGWILVEKEYSDGGISGGTLERPALKELLQDIKNRTFLCRNRHGRLSFCQRRISRYDSCV